MEDIDMEDMEMEDMDIEDMDMKDMVQGLGNPKGKRPQPGVY